eukprot:TRINITY_DN1647_c0_g2_i1.p1 TRINITY_DN1647_c0_g2~~TRINITY_DN1647_c0_g2_i1.p1  ORF type:complete len:326 (+),score=72.17 TRINITY_DN1647_c0_g2_i1:33-1010(+)
MSSIFFFCVLSALLFCAPTCSSLPQHNYLMTTYWKIHPTRSEISTPTLSDVPDFYNLIHVGFAVINSHGALNFSLSPPEEKELLTDIKIKKASGVRVFLSVGGPYSNWDSLKQTPVEPVLVSISELVTHYGFDGVDVNQQKMSNSLEETITTNFVQALSQYLPNIKISLTGQDLYISNVTQKSQGGWNTFESVLSNVGNLTEFVQIMAFSEGLDPVTDYEYWSTGFTNSAVSWGGYPSREILLGLPISSSMSGYLELSEALSDIDTLKQEYNIDEDHFFGGLMTWNANADTGGQYGQSMASCLFDDICSTTTGALSSQKRLVIDK